MDGVGCNGRTRKQLDASAYKGGQQSSMSAHGVLKDTKQTLDIIELQDSPKFQTTAKYVARSSDDARTRSKLRYRDNTMVLSVLQGVHEVCGKSVQRFNRTSRRFNGLQ